MVNFIKKRLQNEYFKNVVTLTAGTAIAQALPLLVSPLLTRLYTLEEFGDLNLFITIVTFFAVISSLRYEVAIILPKENPVAEQLLKLAGRIVFFFFIGLSIATLVWGGLAQVDILPGFLPIYILIPIAVWAFAWYLIQSNWLSRHKEYKQMAMARVGLSGVNAIAGVALGFAKLGSWGLALAYTLGQATAVWVGYNKKYKHAYANWVSTPLTKFSATAREYSKFPKFNVPYTILDTTVNFGITFWIDFFLGTVVNGAFGFSYRLLKAPVTLVAGSLYQVFYQQAVEMHNAGQNLQKRLLKLYTKTFLLGIIPFGMLTVIAPPLFAWLFGDKWLLAGQISAIMAPWLLLNFMVAPAASLMVIKNKQDVALWFMVADIFLRFGAFWVFYNLFPGQPLWPIGGYTAAACLSHTGYLIWFYLLAGQTKRVEAE